MRRLNLSLGRPLLLEDPDEVLQACARFRAGGIVAFDTEATGLDIMRDIPLSVGLSDGIHRVAVAAGHGLPQFEALQTLFDDPNIIFVGHSVKYDAHMLANLGMRVVGPWHDTMVMATMSDTSRSSRALKSLIVSLYGPDDPRSLQYADFSGTFGKVTKARTAGDLLRSAPAAKVAQYVTCDAWATFTIYTTLKAQLQSLVNWRGQTLWDLYLQVEVPFTKLLWDMERVGTQIDSAYLESLGDQWRTELSDLERRFAQVVGRPININSVPQLRSYFLIEKKLTTERRTMGGDSGETKASLDKTTLKRWADSGVVEAQLVLRHRQLAKLVGTYVEPLIQLRDAQNRVHTSFTQIVATGRLASSDPNLQNIPMRTEDGRQIRNAFIASEGHVLLVRDYDQIEMKLAAALSGDENMIRIIREGKDIHSGNAAVAFDVPYEDIVKAVKAKEALAQTREKGEEGIPLSDHQKTCLIYRDQAKTVGFETLYGGGTRKLGVLLGCSTDKAVEIQTRFFAPFQTLLKFIKSCCNEAIVKGYVQTALGRFRSLPAARLLGTEASAEALRQAFNSPIQGTASDTVKLAMLRCIQDPLLASLDCRLLLQVHDELIFEVPAQNIKRANKRVRYHMEHCLDTVGLVLPFILTSSGRYGRTWADAK